MDEIIYLLMIIWFLFGVGVGRRSNARTYDRPGPTTNPPELGYYGISLETRGSHDTDPFTDQDPR